MPAKDFRSQARQLDYFAHIYNSARELAAAEKEGDARKLEELDFAVFPACIRCMRYCPIDPTTQEPKPLRCSRCKSAIYCGRKCQVADWNPGTTASSSHKVLCPKNVEHMKRLPWFRAVLEQFPWARIESDGTCPHNILKARIGVLGSGPSFGYWSVPGGQMPHDPSEMIRVAPNSPSIPFQLTKRQHGYIHGAMLLEPEWPKDDDAWMLNDHGYIPRLNFGQDHRIPSFPKMGQVKDWASWYQWRGLSLESPAALLMDGPLSVYHLLVNILKMIDPNATPSKRQVLRVCCLGAEIELNFLPLFSELALLLPNTDIILTFFGKAVYDLVAHARSKYPKSIAARDIVWSYAAPEKTGGGSVVIKLHSKAESWTRETMMFGTAEEDPDALVALNAGLLSYTTWGEPMIISAATNIPFAITEYAEQSLEIAAQALPDIQFQAIMQKWHNRKGSYGYEHYTSSEDHIIAPNPFHRPGQRGLGVTRVPNCYNGFTMPVTMKDIPIIPTPAEPDTEEPKLSSQDTVPKICAPPAGEDIPAASAVLEPEDFSSKLDLPLSPTRIIPPTSAWSLAVDFLLTHLQLSLATLFSIVAMTYLYFLD